jgi:hypothetical protein
MAVTGAVCSQRSPGRAAPRTEGIIKAVECLKQSIGFNCSKRAADYVGCILEMFYVQAVAVFMAKFVVQTADRRTWLRTRFGRGAVGEVDT